MRAMNKSEQNKMENKKAMKPFIIILIVSGIIGGIIGAGVETESIKEFTAKLVDIVSGFIYISAPWLTIIFAIVGALAAKTFSSKARKACLLLSDNFDMLCEVDIPEEEQNAIEKTIDKSMLFISLMQILTFASFAFSVVRLVSYMEDGKFILFTLSCILFVVSNFFSIKIQASNVELVKYLHPHISGSIYDKNFNKVWIETCDEMEKMTIYKAGYKAYSNGVLACYVLWVITVFLSMALNLGYMPTVMVIIIMGVLNISYYIEASRLSYGK